MACFAHTQLSRSMSAPHVQRILHLLNLLFGEIDPPTTVWTSTERRKV